MVAYVWLYRADSGERSDALFSVGSPSLALHAPCSVARCLLKLTALILKKTDLRAYSIFNSEG